MLVTVTIGCAKSTEAPVTKKEKVGPVAVDPRAATPMLEKARKAAEEANARNTKATDAMKNLQ